MDTEDANLQEQEVKLENFDHGTLTEIFSYLDTKSLLNLCQTSSQFNEIISPSKVLMKNVVLHLQLINDETLKGNSKRLTEYDSLISRKYQNLKITNLKENLIESRQSMKKLIEDLMDKLGQNVVSLNIENCYLSRAAVTILLKKFPKLVELKLENLMFSDDFSPSEMAQENADDFLLSFPHLKTFRLISTDFFCFLIIKSHTSLERLEISAPIYTRTDVEELETFLLNQRNLKFLKLIAFRFNSTYSTNRLRQVPFQLNTLILDDVSWDIIEHCGLFLKSQHSLKHFGLRLFQRWISPREEKFQWFNEMMKHVLVDNKQLQSVSFNEFSSFAYLKDDEFLVGECNKNVKSLRYARCRTSTASEFLQISSRLFPNLEKISVGTNLDDPVNILQRLGSFTQLKSLSIQSKTSNLTHLPQEIMANLTNFGFINTDEAKCSGILKTLLENSPKIEQLYLNIEPLTFEQITELVLPFAPTLKSLKILNLYLNMFEVEMLSRNFPQLRLISSDIRPSSEVSKMLHKYKITFNPIQTQCVREETTSG